MNPEQEHDQCESDADGFPVGSPHSPVLEDPDCDGCREEFGAPSNCTHCPYRDHPKAKPTCLHPPEQQYLDKADKSLEEALSNLHVGMGNTERNEVRRDIIKARNSLGDIKIEVNRAHGPKSPCCRVAMVWINANQDHICPNCGKYPLSSTQSLSEEPEIHPDILKAARGGGAAHYSTEDGQQYLVTFIGLKETAYDGPDISLEEPQCETGPDNKGNCPYFPSYPTSCQKVREDHKCPAEEPKKENMPYRCPRCSIRLELKSRGSFDRWWECPECHQQRKWDLNELAAMYNAMRHLTVENLTTAAIRLEANDNSLTAMPLRAAVKAMRQCDK